MTKDEIIEMARRAGVRDDEHIFEFSQYKYLERFAKLVAEHEREACAKTCEQITNDMSKWHSAYLGVTSETKFIRKTGEIIAEPFIQAIRARGQA
jgi:hypothetical protein